MSTTAVLPENSGSRLIKKLTKDLTRFFGKLWRILSKKLTFFIFAFIYVIHVTAFAESRNEHLGDGGCGGKVAALTFITFLISIVFPVPISRIFTFLKLNVLQNLEKADDPLEGLEKMHRYQFTCICAVPMIVATYFAGSFTGSDKDQYAKIINNQALLINQSIWIFPSGFVNDVTVIRKKQDISFSVSEAETADGALVKGILKFDGSLSDDTNQWFDFDKKKSDFIQQLTAAYARAIKLKHLADLDKSLVISFETSKESANIFSTSSIVPSENGIIEAYDFKVLAKQNLKK